MKRARLRLAYTAYQAARITANTLARRAKSAITGKRGAEAKSAERLATAEDIAQAVGNMRGVAIKLAQMAAYLDPSMPNEYATTLTPFQNQAPSMSWQLARTVLREDLGKRLKQLADIDPIPIASASIGQVHRAKLSTGELVAVKIQFPEARELMEADLRNTSTITSMLSLFLPALSNDEIAEELTDRLREELDYLHEAAVQQSFAEFYKDHPYLVVPKPYLDLCSQRVLVTDLVVGRNFYQVLSDPQKERNKLGELLFRFVFRSLYQLKMFNGDPHPGNYVFLDDTRIALLDFGFSKHFDESEIEIFESMIKAMVINRDPASFSKIAYQAGLLTKPDIDVALVADYFSDFYDLVLEDHDFEVTEAYATQILRRTFDRSHPIAGYLRVPRSFVVIQRINLGLYALLAHLRAANNWRKIAEEIWPFVEAAPSTEIGRAERRWLDQRKLA
jgi:predicted unusual protein kinase regulating ubiquinone biosynthesis (AarF/ABC1/UbiB family)